MAESVKLANMARLLAIVHIIVGFLLICFGIADRVIYYRYSWTGHVYFGIWIGVWMCITGGLGIPGSTREITRSRNVFAGVFMGLSITSAVFGGIIIICYSVSISEFRYRSYYRIRRNYHSQMAISICMLLLGVTEFVIGIWAPICCCLMKPCSGGCCACCEAVPQHQGQQIIYTANTTGYVMTHGVDGVPVAIPVQAGGGMVALQASHAQASQPPMVLVPVSGGIEGQSAMIQVAPAIPGTVSVPQEAVKPPPYV